MIPPKVSSWLSASCTVAAVEPEGVADASLVASPNPFRDRVEVRLARNLAGDGPRWLEILDAGGRRVARLPLSVAAGGARASWDGRDLFGRALPAGIYRTRVAGAHTDSGVTLVRLR